MKPGMYQRGSNTAVFAAVAAGTASGVFIAAVLTVIVRILL